MELSFFLSFFLSFSDQSWSLFSPRGNLMKEMTGFAGWVGGWVDGFVCYV